MLQIRVLKRFEDAKRTLCFCNPLAEDIRRHEASCPCCHGSMYLTFTEPDFFPGSPLDETIEHCFTFCPQCMYTQSAARKKK